ncbi:MAG TPA: hypothetical protein DDW85_00635 [Porphyromonadaceae bacterium]|nr:hypothetical protein [Porphyromonadaceae bacterium]
MNIYDSTGKEILDILVDDSSVRYRSIMSDDSLTLDFSTTGPVSVPRWAYCVYEGARYTLFYTENFKKNNTRDFEYTLTLHGWREWLNFVKFKDVSSKPYRLKFSLTATPREFMSALVACLNLADPMGGWAVGDCIEATEKALSFNHEWCIDVLGRFVSEFNTEYEFESKIVHLRKVEKYKGDPLPLSYGKGNGFKSGVGRSNEGNKQPIGKLFVEGGDRNIDYSTYKSNTLLLPKSATLEYNGKTYRTDADGVYITRDGNNNIGEDSYDGSSHYPKRVGTVSEVIPVDAPKNFYDIKDSSIPASLDYSKCRIGGEKATIVFQSGVLAGREFDLEQTDIALTGYIHSERRFKIVPAELDGYMMPGGAFVPAVGDKYAIFNISMPSAYISDDATKTGASWDMFREAVKYFAEEEQDKFSFTGELDGVWSKSRWLEIGGKIVPGGHVLFSDPQFQPDGVLIRITAVKDYVNSPHKPEITLSNAPVSGSFSADLGKIEAGEVIRESDKKEVIRYSKRQWRDARETMSMLQESLLNYSGSINPITVRTMQLLVGDEGLQFRFVNSKTNPQRINHDVSFNATTKVLTAASGILQHMTLGITTLKKTHAASEYKYWDMSAYASPALEAHKAYYLYAKCSKTGTAGTFLLSETAIAMESVADYYHFLLGILNSEQDDDRSFAPLYGYTEILPGRVTTDKIVSQDGKTYFDLLGGVIGGRIKFQSGGEDKDLGDWAKSADDGIQDAKDKVDDLQTGGVNLYLNSNKKVTNAGYGLTTYSFAPGTELIAGEDYVLSIKGTLTDPSQDGFYINVQINDGSWSALVIVGEADKDVDGVYRKVFKMPSLAGIDTHNISGLYSNPPGTYKQSSVDWIMLQKGNKPSISWQENPADTQARIADAKQAGKDAQDSITETNATVSGLKNFTDTSFRDGIIDRTESAAIEKYKNSLNETMLKAEASYNKVYGNSYLEGSAKTNLLNAKINLWGARDALVSSINSAIANGETTAAEKTDVDSKFNSFNNLMSAYQSALEEANKAIQVKLDKISKDYSSEIAGAIGGKMLYRDPSFKETWNNTNRYNNAGDYNVWERVGKTSDAPSDSNFIMRYRYEYQVASPYFGGFFFGTPTRANAVFVTKIIAKIPVGRSISFHSHQFGDGGQQKWLTSTAGTGKYETYICKLICGTAGTFSSTNFFAFAGGPDEKFQVDIAYATVFDMTLYDATADEAKAQANALKYLKDNIKLDSEINGGLILTTFLGARDSNGIIRSYQNGDPALNPIAFATGVNGFGGVSLDSINAIYNPLSPQILALRSHLNIAYTYIGTMLEYKYGTAGEITEAEYNAAVTASNNAYNACNTSLTAVLSNSTNAYNQIVVGNYNIGSYITNVTNNNNSVKSNYTTIYNSVYLDDADIKNSLNSTYNAYISNIQDYIDILNGIKNKGVETEGIVLLHDGGGFLAGGDIKWVKNSNGKWDTTYRGKIIASDGNNTIEINPEDASFSMYTKNGVKTASLDFQSQGTLFFPKLQLFRRLSANPDDDTFLDMNAGGVFIRSRVTSPYIYSNYGVSGPSGGNSAGTVSYQFDVDNSYLWLILKGLPMTNKGTDHVYKENGYLKIG